MSTAGSIIQKVTVRQADESKEALPNIEVDTLDDIKDEIEQR